MDYNFYILLIKWDKSTFKPDQIHHLLELHFGYVCDPILRYNHGIASYIYKYKKVLSYYHLLILMLKHSATTSLIRNYISVSKLSNIYCSSTYTRALSQLPMLQQYKVNLAKIRCCRSYPKGWATLVPEYMKNILDGNPYYDSNKVAIMLFWHLNSTKLKYIESNLVYHIDVDENFNITFGPVNGHYQPWSSFKVKITHSHSLIGKYQVIIQKSKHRLILLDNPYNPMSHSLMEIDGIIPNYKLVNVKMYIIDLRNKTLTMIKYNFPQDYVEMQGLYMRWLE